jgi:hypothetical protein
MRELLSAGFIGMLVFIDPEAVGGTSEGDKRGMKDASVTFVCDPSSANRWSLSEVNSMPVWLRDRLDGPSLKDNEDWLGFAVVGRGNGASC